MLFHALEKSGSFIFIHFMTLHTVEEIFNQWAWKLQCRIQCGEINSRAQDCLKFCLWMFGLFKVTLQTFSRNKEIQKSTSDCLSALNGCPS